MKTSKLTPKIKARIVAAARKGTPQKTIAADLCAEGIMVVQQTISAVLRQADPDGMATGRRTKLDSRSPAVRGTAQRRRAPAPPPEPDDEATDEDSEEFDVGAGEGLDVALRRLRGRARQAGRLADEAAASKNLAGFAAMAKLQAELAERLRRLIPPPPLDPALDPAHVEARERLVADFGAHLAALRERKAAS